jgi:excisionase family DNA binding protein
MPPAPRTYTPQQVARHLCVSPQTVQRWVDAGRLRAWKTLGGHRRIDADDVDALVAQRREVLAATEVRVLVVDDHPLYLELMTELVLQALPDATVDTAGDGFEALIAVGRHMPHIVLADLAMPHMSGVEMLRRLRQESAAGPTAIAVSALSEAEARELDGLPADVPLLTKPVDPRQLHALLRAAVDARAPHARHDPARRAVAAQPAA